MSHLWDLEGQCYPPTPTAFDNITPQYDQSSIEITQWDYPPRDSFDTLPRYQLNTPLPRFCLDRYYPDAAPHRYHSDVAPSRYHPEVSPPRFAPPRYHPSPPLPRYHPEFKVSSPGSNVDQEPSTPSDTTTMPETPDMTQFPYSPSLPGSCLAAGRDTQSIVLEIQGIDGQIHKIPIQHLKRNRKFKCEFNQCTLAFRRKEHLSRHMLTHTGVRAYECNFCHERFSRSDNLRKHKLELHECNFCHEKFSRSNDLRKHKLEIHEEKKGACRKFKPKSNHVKRHRK